MTTDHDELFSFAREEYQGVAYDLLQAVPLGSGHYYAAVDHVADRMYEKFYKTHPKANFRSVTVKALKKFIDDDRAETRKNDAKQKRKEAKAARPLIGKPALKIKLTWWQEMGLTMKPRKGIGSY